MLHQILKHYSEQDKLSLLIRHGDRYPIPPESFGQNVLLNDEGKKNSLNFGKKLATLNINRILTSPVQRCIQTAELISKGYGKDLDIIVTTALGEPGLHISDAVAAGNFYLRHGFNQMYELFLQEAMVPGVPPIKELNKSITDFLTEQTAQNGITIFVTHDMLIAFYHYSLDKTVYNIKTKWINYLTGLMLKNGNYEK
ncbi:MAG TPA: histidine phosphatase family protein [Chitinophagales bacterium]|nr:histidine phosphatase family protein [Chitinophagales bacterium]